MSRRAGWGVATAILAASLSVVALMVSLRPEPASREPPSQVPVAITEPAAAVNGPLIVHAAGTVRPRARVDVAAETSGRVAWVEPVFESGGRVRAEQTLFRLDDTAHRHRVERARAAVTVQEVELLKVEEEARVAREQYQRFQNREGESASEPGPLALWEPQLEAARAALARDRAALAEAELEHSRTTVRAPFDAVVLAESVDLGQFVRAGVPVGQLYAADAVEVVTPLTDADAALVPGLWGLRAGQADRSVRARVIADHGDARYAWNGWVDRVEATLDEDTRTLDVVIRVPRPLSGGAAVTEGTGERTEYRADAPPLLVGRFVAVEIDGLTPEDAFRLRRPALRPDDEVWAVDGDTVTIVPVNVLARTEGDVFVTGALSDGQPVVVGGLAFATEGMEVRTSDRSASAEAAPESGR